VVFQEQGSEVSRGQGSATWGAQRIQVRIRQSRSLLTFVHASHPKPSIPSGHEQGNTAHGRRRPS
jgi:hypothetical protein